MPSFVKVGRKWHYLYRAIDRDGTPVDSMLSERRAIASAKCFFTQAREVMGQNPPVLQIWPTQPGAISNRMCITLLPLHRYYVKLCLWQALLFTLQGTIPQQDHQATGTRQDGSRYFATIWSGS